jgi:2-dehydropantoate 2-reductase
MRIAVVGAGAVGGAIAALLDRAGHQVEVTARGDHLAAIREHGIRLSGGWVDHVAAVAANERLERAPELVLVTTKAQHSVAAMRENIVMLRGVPVVVIQNGLDAIGNGKAASPRSDIIGGLAVFASSYLSPGEIVVTTPGRLYLGVAAGDDDLPARFAARVLQEALPTEVLGNFAGAQWSKLVINQVNALPAITGLSVQQVVAIPGLRRILTEAIRENARVAFANRIRFATLQGLTNAIMRAVSALPLWAGQFLPRLISARLGSVPNPGSTLQSIRRGQSTEIDSLNGAVVRAAAAAGRSAPVNSAMVELVHEVEGGGAFLPPDEVVARVLDQQRSRNTRLGN